MPIKIHVIIIFRNLYQYKFLSFKKMFGVLQLVYRFYFALFSLLFLSFSRLPNTPLEDDNSRDAWLSLKALKRRVASLVVGGLAVSSCF